MPSAPLSLPSLEVSFLCLLALLLALNVLIWQCNKDVLAAVYDSPHLFFLLPREGLSPHPLPASASGSAELAATQAGGGTRRAPLAAASD